MVLSFEHLKRKEIEKNRFQFYLDYREKTKRNLQFSSKFLTECLLTLVVSFIVLIYDKNHLINVCLDKREIIRMNNIFINFLLYLKFILFFYLRIFRLSEKIYHHLFYVLTIILIDFTNSSRCFFLFEI